MKILSQNVIAVILLYRCVPQLRHGQLPSRPSSGGRTWALTATGDGFHDCLVPYRSRELPFAEGAPTPQAKEERVLEDDVKVLLIEDDVATAEMYRLRLVADGYSVVTASDGQDGLRMAADHQPDFIYLDLRLPALDGFEVLEQLRGSEVTMHIPVIILTNYGEPELRERGMKLGALEFLVKAETTPAQLSQSVERATGPRALPST
jgi:CheY-like chemotaxis protein